MRIATELVLKLICLLLLIAPVTNVEAGKSAAWLSERNTEAPFCYRPGGQRTWPLISGKLTANNQILLKAEQKGKLLAKGPQLDFEGYAISVSMDGRLHITSANKTDSDSFQLIVILKQQEKIVQTQTLQVYPAPPDRPISYLSDQLDDLIRIFWDNETSQWKPVDKSAFDQYFRRLQAHGVSRLIVWLGAYPVIENPDNYRAANWELYAKQARAILNSEALNRVMYGRRGHRVAYQWHGFIMQFRLHPEWGNWYAQSAADHGISLTATFRPFEQGLMKYLVIPAFDEQGAFLWNFLPYATPTANFSPETTAFAHYHKLFEAAGNADKTEVVSLTFESVPESKPQELTKDDLKIYATDAPPIANDSFVLVRNTKDEFQLQTYATIAERVTAQRRELKGWTLNVLKDGAIQIDGLQRPPSSRYLVIESGSPFSGKVQLPAELPISAHAKAGNRVGRFNAYWALEETSPENATTRIAGITPAGGYRTDFQTIENSFRIVGKGPAVRPLGQDQIIIDFGPDWLPEIMDLNQSATRAMFVKQLQTILQQPAFDEIMLNTRSHTHLAGTSGDGESGVQTTGHYRRKGKSFRRLTLDRAYAPVSAAQLDALQPLLKSDDPKLVEKITTWPAGEWTETCQSPDTEYVWRYNRNVAVSKGLRALLQDLENTFPKTRIRAVMPPRAAVEQQVTAALPGLKQPEGEAYDASYYRYLTSGLNQIPSITEGTALLDLRGLRVEPALLGFRLLPDSGPAKLQLETYLADQSDNHGSTYRGPKSFFYEAQESLRARDKTQATRRREEIIDDLLKQESIKEVILYEAADWIYYLPAYDPHRYLNSDKVTSAEK